MSRGVRLFDTNEVLAIGERSLEMQHAQNFTAGRLAVLSGPSGCGKSTLLERWMDELEQHVRLGYVPQDPGRALVPRMTGREVLGFSLDAELNSRARIWFGEDFDGLLDRPVATLSEGQRQRLLLTREILRLSAAGRKPALLLCDEPFAALDPSAHLRVLFGLAEWVAEEGTARSVVLVSHSPGADRAWLERARASKYVEGRLYARERPLAIELVRWRIEAEKSGAASAAGGRK